MQTFKHKNRCKWIIFFSVAVLTLVFLVVGAVALIMMSENEHIPTTNENYAGDALSSGVQQQQSNQVSPY